MRVNIYAEEMTNRLEIIAKEIDGHTFTGLRFYLELPATVGGKQYQGPFMHHPGDDDSSAVTFWGKRDLRKVMGSALQLLDKHYDGVPIAPTLTPPAPGAYWSGQGGIYAGTMPARDGVPARHLVFSAEEAKALSWGGYGEDQPGAASHHDGRANTAALTTTPGKHPAAEWAASYTADGHTDFHLPSHAELCMAWICAPEIFDKAGWYWSSTQSSRDDAFAQDFEDGSSLWDGKDYEFRVRAVRVISL